MRQTLPPPLPVITSIRNLDKPPPIHVLKRGEEDEKGELVEMSVPSLFAALDSSETLPDSDGPRTHLAKWIVDPTNPLTARVLVN